MSDALQLWHKPEAEHVTLIAGWRQWADAGSVSSGLPQYLIEHLNARHIGLIDPGGFYIFQVPGAHDLMRPTVKFENGYPVSLEAPKNEFYYAGDEHRGFVIFLGDEPQLDIERYIATLLDAAAQLGVQRIIGLGGVYGELPYDKERQISANYSLPTMRHDVERLAVNLSGYEGGASIGSYLCRRAGDRGMEYIGLYAFVPAYDFTVLAEESGGIRIENDYSAWLGVMRRLIYMFKMPLELSDLEAKSRLLTQLVATRLEEIDKDNPQLEVQTYLASIAEEFTELTFNPLDEVWDEELRRLLNKYNEDDSQ